MTLTTRPTVAEYAVSRLASLGIKHVFGVPGDYAFPIDDAIEKDPRLTFVVSTNELNAAYAADGYARIHGAAMITTTHGVGELSALNGIMGSKAEYLPVFHLVGSPSNRLARARRHVHHTLGDGDTTNFRALSAAAACVSAVLSPDNAVSEMERVISTALHRRQPAVIFFPQDYALMPICDSPIAGVPLDQVPPPSTESRELQAALKVVGSRLRKAKKVVAVVTFKVGRFGLLKPVQQLIESLNVPFIATAIDKGTLSEEHPLYLGLYRGANSPAHVLQAVEEADVVLDIGGCLFDDLSTGFGTTDIARDRLVTLGIHHVEMTSGAGNVQLADHRSYEPIWLGDLIEGMMEENGDLPCLELPAYMQQKTATVAAITPAAAANLKELISYDSVTDQLTGFLRSGDVLVLETGTASVHMCPLALPEGVTYMNQTLWGSIGWATPAAFGVAMGAPDRQVVLVTGDGSHQLTATEVGNFGKYETKPIIILLNNGIYGVEEFLEKNKGASYNVLGKWKYAQLPAAMGCTDWLCCTVETNEELMAALEKARGNACYIEVMLQRENALLTALPSRSVAQLSQAPPRLDSMRSN